MKLQRVTEDKLHQVRRINHIDGQAGESMPAKDVRRVGGIELPGRTVFRHLDNVDALSSGHALDQGKVIRM